MLEITAAQGETNNKHNKSEAVAELSHEKTPVAGITPTDLQKGAGPPRSAADFTLRAIRQTR